MTKQKAVVSAILAAFATGTVNAAEVNFTADDLFTGSRVESTGLAMGGGKRVENDSTVTMNGTRFIRNALENTGTTQGGGYYQIGGTLDASGITVNNNTAKGTIVNGAGMMLFNVNGSIKGATFTGNQGEITGQMSNSEAYGGALSIQRYDSNKDLAFSISDSTFSSNTLTAAVKGKSTYGAAIYLEGGEKGINVTMRGINATENSAGKGGAIGAYDASFSITDSKINQNTASDGEGGAIFVETYSSAANTVSISNSSFTGNTAKRDDGLARGGAIYIGSTKDGQTATTLTGVKLIDNTVRNVGTSDQVAQGGGFYQFRGTVNASDLTVSGNEAVNGWGGGAFLDQANASISKTLFEGNKATDGGAIYNYALGGGSETGLNISDSTFKDNIATTGQGGAIRNGVDGKLTFTGTNVFTGNMAQENPNDIYNSGLVDIDSGETTLNGGIVSEGANASVNISENATLGLGGVSKINTLTGENGTMKIVDAQADVTVTTNGATGLTLAGTGDVNDALNGSASALADIVTFENGNTEDIALYMSEGMYEGETTAILGSDGTVRNVSTKTNTLMQSTLELASVAPLSMNRMMLSDLRKRMGDIRTDTNTNGAWARYEGGRLSGSNGLENDFNTIQVGGDTKFGDWRVGGAFNYTKGDADYARGSADLDSYGLSAYGLWLGEQGQFVDIVARVSKADTDMKVDGFKTGSMDSMAYSLSGEFGWRFALNDMVYVEPQVEAAYTYVDADDLDIDTASYKFDSVNSFIGRAGFAAGLKCPDNFGDVYFHVSALHEFSGDSEITGGNGSKYKIDGKDTWVEYGIGANFNINKATYVWADVQRTSGADLDEDWRANVGVRYSF